MSRFKYKFNSRNSFQNTSASSGLTESRQGTINTSNMNQPRKMRLGREFKSATLLEFRNAVAQSNRFEIHSSFKYLISNNSIIQSENLKTNNLNSSDLKANDLQSSDLSFMLTYISQNNNPLRVLTILDNIIKYSLKKSIKFDQKDHHSILKILYRANEHQALCEYVDNLTTHFQEGQEHDMTTFNYMIASFYAIGDHANTIVIFDAFCAAHPTLKYLNQDGWAYKLAAHSKLNEHELVETLYAECRDKLRGLDVSILDEGYIRASTNLSSIQKTFSKMIPSLSGYDSIIAATATTTLAPRYFKELVAYCKAMDERRGIRALKNKEYEINYYNGRCTPTRRNCRNLLPLSTSITSIISYYYQIKAYDEVDRLFKAYYNLMELDPAAYEVLCWAAWVSGSKRVASEYLLLMVQMSFMPDPALYALIQEYRDQEDGVLEDGFGESERVGDGRNGNFIAEPCDEDIETEYSY